MCWWSTDCLLPLDRWWWSSLPLCTQLAALNILTSCGDEKTSLGSSPRSTLMFHSPPGERSLDKPCEMESDEWWCLSALGWYFSQLRPQDLVTLPCAAPLGQQGPWQDMLEASVGGFTERVALFFYLLMAMTGFRSAALKVQHIQKMLSILKSLLSDLFSICSWASVFNKENMCAVNIFIDFCVFSRQTKPDLISEQLY